MRGLASRYDVELDDARITSIGGIAAQVVELTNAARTEKGCGPLKADPRLTEAAQEHA